MLSLITGGLSDTICGVQINTDFKAWIKWLHGISINNADLVAIGLSEIFGDNLPNDEDLAQEMLNFAMSADHPISGDSGEVVFSFDFDADCIDADFKRFYNIDLAKTNMHWLIFKARLNNLPSGSATSERQKIRTTKLKDIDKEHRADFQKAQEAYRLAQPDDERKQAALKVAGELFYNT